MRSRHQPRPSIFHSGVFFRRCSVALVAAAIVFAASATAVAGALEDALAKKAEGKFAEAVPLFERAVAENGSSADAALGLGQVLAGLGRYDAAVKALSAGAKANPEHVGLMVERARTHLLIADAGNASGEDGAKILSDAADAELWLKKALKADEKSADARVLMGKVKRYQGGGDSDEAIAWVKGVLADFPDHFDANWELGQYHFRRGRLKQSKGKDDWAAAETQFAKCMQIDPKSGLAVFNRTLAMAWLGKSYAELAPGYEQASKLLPGDENPLRQLYKATGGDKAGRVAAFERVDASRPGDKTVLLYLAYAQSEAGDREAGLATLVRAEKASPGDPYIALNRGHLLLDMERIDDAMKAYTETLDACGDAYYKDIYGQINQRAWNGTGNPTPEQRDALWTLLWKKWPTVSDAPNNAGLWYRDNSRGRDKKAREKRSSIWYLRAVEAAPQNVQILNDCGLIFHDHLAEFDRAAEYYQRAVEAGGDQGLNWNGEGGIDHVGYRDAINNYGKLLVATKQWKTLQAFAETHVPVDHPSRETWIKMGKAGK